MGMFLLWPFGMALDATNAQKNENNFFALEVAKRPFGPAKAKSSRTVLRTIVFLLLLQTFFKEIDEFFLSAGRLKWLTAEGLIDFLNFFRCCCRCAWAAESLRLRSFLLARANGRDSCKGLEKRSSGCEQAGHSYKETKQGMLLWPGCSEVRSSRRSLINRWVRTPLILRLSSFKWSEWFVNLWILALGMECIAGWKI